MTAFRFVDAHHHLWKLDALAYPWLNGPPDMEPFLGSYDAIRADYLPRDLARDGASSNLVKSVHIETADHPHPVAETALLQAMADADPGGFPHAIVAHADLLASDLDETLDRHAEHANFRGLRALTLRDPSFVFDDRLPRGLRSLGERGLSLDVDWDWTLAPVWLALARRAPDLPFLLDHCGFPKLRSPTYLRHWREALARMADLPNVACKVSGLGMGDHAWTTPSIGPIVTSVIDLFGPERILFGSNWPVDSLYGSYGDLIAAYRSIVSGRSSADQERMFAGNAERVYRI